ncbi:MAG: hypothetical protein ABIK48_01760 [candidate division WOR-3 bacterium]
MCKLIPAGVTCPFNLYSINGLGYSSTSDRLFTSAARDWREGQIFVIDCASDSIVNCILGYPTSATMWWDSVGNKMYLSSIQEFDRTDWITVVNCVSGEVQKVIRTGLYKPAAGIYLPQYRKIYVAGEHDGVAVIDCECDTVIKRFDNIVFFTSELSIWQPEYAPSVNKVYFPSVVTRAQGLYGDTILIIDPRTDSIIGGIRVQPWVTRSSNYRAGEFWGMDYAPWSNRLYVVSCTAGQGVVRSFISVYDCTTDSLIGQSCYQIPVIAQIYCNPLNRKIYISSPEDFAIYVFRDSLVGVEERGVVSSPAEAEPTLVRSILYLPERAGAAGKPVLVDITGRRVLELVPGANDVRGLTPGVYFVRSNAGVERKVVIAR